MPIFQRGGKTPLQYISLYAGIWIFVSKVLFFQLLGLRNLQTQGRFQCLKTEHAQD